MVGGWVKNGRFWRYVIMQWPPKLSEDAIAVSDRNLHGARSIGNELCRPVSHTRPPMTTTPPPPPREAAGPSPAEYSAARRQPDEPSWNINSARYSADPVSFIEIKLHPAACRRVVEGSGPFPRVVDRTWVRLIASQPNWIPKFRMASSSRAAASAAAAAAAAASAAAAAAAAAAERLTRTIDCSAAACNCI